MIAELVSNIDNHDTTGFFKVGGTSRNAGGRTRRNELQNGNPRRLKFLGEWDVLDCHGAETDAREAINQYHYRGEWFGPLQSNDELKTMCNLARNAIAKKNKETNLLEANDIKLMTCN